MINFCPGCGIKLESNFNFCPSCGMSLAGDKFKSEKTVKSSNTKLIICDNCGEENPKENIVCDSCGVKLEGTVIDKNDTPNKTTNVNASIKSKEIQSVKKTKPVQTNKNIDAEEKTLNTNKLLLSIGSVIVVIVVILLSAGVFETDAPVTANETNVHDQSSGVDLSNLNLINELQAKVDKDANDLVSLLELAHLQNDSRLYEKAIITYKQYLEKKPDDADARIDMGVCYYNLRDYDNAIAEMTNALRYKPDHQIGHLNLGIVNLSAGNLEKSKEWLLKAVSLNPNNDVGKRAQELLQSH